MRVCVGKSVWVRWKVGEDKGAEDLTYGGCCVPSL